MRAFQNWTEAQVAAHNARVAGVRLDMGPPADAVDREDSLHDFVLDECRRRGWICLHGSMAHRARRTEAEPDCVALASHGRTILLELKSKTGKPTPAQLALAAWAKKLGHEHSFARSESEVLAALDGTNYPGPL
jgi:hypothetical protein